MVSQEVSERIYQPRDPERRPAPGCSHHPLGPGRGQSRRERPALAQSQRSLCEAAAVLGRRFAGELAKGGGKRACLAETDTESNFRHRQPALSQQGLGTLDSPARQISMWRHAERVLERSGEMERAELHQPSQ